MLNFPRLQAVAFKSGLIVLSLLILEAHAKIKLPTIVSDHAVQRREAPIHVWRTATPGANLTVLTHQQGVSTVANQLGQWESGWPQSTPAHPTS